MQSVLLTGATGLVGGSVLRALLAADDVQRIVSLGRRPTGFVDTRLKEVSIGDFADTSALTPHLEGIDAVFHCLSTYSSMVTRSEYETITLTYLQALLDAAANNAPQSTFCLFSAAGARPDGGGLSFAGVIPIWRRFCAANSILQIMLRAHLARPLFGCHLRILVASIGRRGSGAVPWRSMLYRSVRI